MSRPRPRYKKKMKLESETEAAVKAAKGEQRDGADLLRGGTLVKKKRGTPESCNGAPSDPFFFTLSWHPRAS
jgi:hypothetical protein